MKVAPLLPLVLWLLLGCAPDTGGPSSVAAVSDARRAPSVTAAGAAGTPALPDATAASYEVSIASAEADRVRARDLCDSKVKAERAACIDAADTAYEQAKSAADSAQNAAP
jgi:hypothetical protein